MDGQFAGLQDGLWRWVGATFRSQNDMATRISLEVKKEIVAPCQPRGKKIVAFVVPPYPDLQATRGAVTLRQQPPGDCSLASRRLGWRRRSWPRTVTSHKPADARLRGEGFQPF